MASNGMDISPGVSMRGAFVTTQIPTRGGGAVSVQGFRSAPGSNGVAATAVKVIRLREEHKASTAREIPDASPAAFAAGHAGHRRALTVPQRPHSPSSGARSNASSDEPTPPRHSSPAKVIAPTGSPDTPSYQQEGSQDSQGSQSSQGSQEDSLEFRVIVQRGTGMRLDFDGPKPTFTVFRTGTGTKN